PRCCRTTLGMPLPAPFRVSRWPRNACPGIGRVPTCLDVSEPPEVSDRPPFETDDSSCLFPFQLTARRVGLFTCEERSIPRTVGASEPEKGSGNRFSLIHPSLEAVSLERHLNG